MNKIDILKQVSKEVKESVIFKKELSGLGEFDFAVKSEKKESNVPGSGRIVPKEFANFGDLFETNKKK